MIRPEAMGTLRRWGGVGGTLLAAVLAVYWAQSSFGIYRWIGGAIAALALGVAYTEWKRARFHSRGEGPGLVGIDERRVTYMGPVMGGMADLDDVTRIRLIDRAGMRYWELTGPSAVPLLIPVGATGADALADAFAALPGWDIDQALAGLGRGMNDAIGAKRDVIVWQRDPSLPEFVNEAAAPPHRRLH